MPSVAYKGPRRPRPLTSMFSVTAEYRNVTTNTPTLYPTDFGFESRHTDGQ